MLSFIMVLVVFSTELLAQQKVTGNVTDQSGDPLPGVTVVIEGTSTGTATDIDGNYAIEANAESVLVFSFVGFERQSRVVGNSSIINIQMQEDAASLEEVVVVGYGAMKEKDLTTAISTVKTEDLVKTPSPNAMQALQGRVAGVQIVSSGVPGSSPTVRVRGIGSFEGGAAPLYVVDGMFFDNIDFLNPGDIKSISVLKDASSQAIYGIRAANGVVLVETNSGNYEQQPEIIYDGYYGVQNPQNVLKMANAQQFVQYVNETGSAADIAFVQNAIQRYGRSRMDPNIPDVNTDWYREVMGPAPIQNHSLTFNGGSAKTRYSVGGSYFSQDGLLNESRNEYRRLNMRANLNTEVKDWLTVGGTFNLSLARQYVAEEATWAAAYFAVPIIPVYDEQNTAAYPHRLANAQQVGYRGPQNPFNSLLYNDTRNNISKLAGNFHADVRLIPDKLTFHTAYNYKVNQINHRKLNFAYGNGVTEPQSALRRDNSTRFDQIVDNYLTYNNMWGNHMLTATLGQSFTNEYGEGLFARGTLLSPDPTWNNEYLWYLSNAQNFDLENIGDGNTSDNPNRILNINYTSYFGRLAYNYDDRYLVYGTYRVDGTNKFQQNWAAFPTFGVGWVLSEENFFNVRGVDFLKFRASWGQVGNAGISPAVGAPTLEETATAIDDIRIIGRRLNPTFDLIDRWETAEEKNIGINARLFRNRLTLDADYYIRDTRNLAVAVPTPLFAGSQRRSTGAVRNQGVEVALNWENQISQNLSYHIGGNIATLKNSVLSLGGPDRINAGQAEFRQISILDSTYQAFYGYEVVGVFQNESEITNSGYTEEFIAANNLVPGDLIFKDQNGDGIINDEDRVVLGSYFPKLNYGANMGLRYKNLEFSALIQGQSGNKILNRKRGEVIWTNDTNIDADLATNLWRGEGTSNKYPSAAGLRKAWNQNMSDYFVEDGSYFRVQNVQVVYSFFGKNLFGLPMPTTRLSFTAERPLTLFRYNGFNPEVNNGVDMQVYPIPAIYTLGLSIKL